MNTKNAILTMITTMATITTISISTMATITLTTAALFTMNSAHALVGEDQALFFDTNPDLFYKIGGVNRIRQPLTPDTHIAIGLKGDANLGYSCGEFDISAAFSNLMDNFKNGVDDAVNSVVGTINAGITALPSLAIQRAMPGVYDMFQEYKLDAETDINLARTSCEEMELNVDEV